MKYSISTHVLFALALALCAVGCGDEDEPTLERSQAQDTVAAVNDTVQQGLLEFGQVQASERGDGLQVSCPGGGSALFTGMLELEVTPVWVDLDVDVVFDDCRSGTGVVLSGAVQIKEEVQVGGDEVVRVDSRLEGSVDVSGAIDGSCFLDLVVQVDLTPEGRAPFVTVTGAACGHDGGLYNDLQPAPIWELQ